MNYHYTGACANALYAGYPVPQIIQAVAGHPKAAPSSVSIFQQCSAKNLIYNPKFLEAVCADKSICGGS